MQLQHRLVCFFLPLFNCLGGTCCSAGTALNTSISIDDVLSINFGDDAQGAGVSAGAALNASVRNEICHFCNLQNKLQKFCTFILPCFLEKAISELHFRQKDRRGLKPDFSDDNRGVRSGTEQGGAVYAGEIFLGNRAPAAAGALFPRKISPAYTAPPCSVPDLTPLLSSEKSGFKPRRSFWRKCNSDIAFSKKHGRIKVQNFCNLFWRLQKWHISLRTLAFSAAPALTPAP